MKEKKEIARRYDSSAEIYDNRYSEIQEKKYREIFSRVNIRSQKSIIDVGCGSGTFLGIVEKSLTDRSLLVGADLSFEMIKIAHNKYPNVDFVVADSDNLPFKESTFTGVFSVTHLQNLPIPDTTIREINRISTEKADIAISVLRKNWTIDKLADLVRNNYFSIKDSWSAEVEDVGIICTK